MAMDDAIINTWIKTENTKTISRDTEVEFEMDSFDFGDRFDMDFEVGF